MYTRSQPAPFNWPLTTSSFLILSGMMFMWVHFSGILPVMEEVKNLPFAVSVPLHLWALAHLFTVTLVLVLGVLALSYPGVIATEVKKPITWNQYKAMLACVLGAAILYLLLSFYLSLELTAWASFELLLLLLLIGWNTHLIQKLEASRPSC